jgi:hypothetical protein
MPLPLLPSTGCPGPLALHLCGKARRVAWLGAGPVSHWNEHRLHIARRGAVRAMQGKHQPCGRRWVGGRAGKGRQAAPQSQRARCQRLRRSRSTQPRNSCPLLTDSIRPHARAHVSRPHLWVPSGAVCVLCSVSCPCTLAAAAAFCRNARLKGVSAAALSSQPRIHLLSWYIARHSWLARLGPSPAKARAGVAGAGGLGWVGAVALPQARRLPRQWFLSRGLSWAGPGARCGAAHLWTRTTPRPAQR